MKISFIISAYERPEALRTCLSSLVQQTMTDHEMIVVDNSRSPMINGECSFSFDPRISYTYTGDRTIIEGAIHKRCLYRASEIGAQHARGDWLCFPNCDSYYCPWFAERMLKAAEANNWELVYSDIVMGGAGGHHAMQTSPRLCCIDKTCFMIKRELFDGFVGKDGMAYAQADGLTIVHWVEQGLRHGNVREYLVVHN